MASRGPSSEEEDSVEITGGLLEEAMESLEEGVEVPQPTKDNRDKQSSARYRFIILLSHIGGNAEVATWGFHPNPSPGIINFSVANFPNPGSHKKETIVSKTAVIIIAERTEIGIH